MKIRNYNKFQHFKDRRPPWIKLYRDLLDDPEWFALSGTDAKVLVMLWLVASEDESCAGQLPCLDKLSFRFRMPKAKLRQTCQRLTHWIEGLDIKVISNRYQLDAPETETETEGETEGEGEGEPASEMISRQGKRPISEADKPTEKHFALAQQLGVELGPEWGKFKNYCLAHDRRYANFEAAFRNWIARAAEGKGHGYVLRQM